MVYKDKKLEFVKVGENANRVKLSSIYDNNCSSQENVVVDDEMLEYLIAETRKANANERSFRRHFVCLPEEDIRYTYHFFGCTKPVRRLWIERYLRYDRH